MATHWIARLTTIGLLLVLGACAHSQPPPIPLDSIDPRYEGYLRQVREQIKSRWSYPCVNNKVTGRCEYLSAWLLLEFGITTDGQVPYVTVRESSGLPIYDANAVAAVKAAAPFPPVPPEMMAEVPPGSRGVGISARFTYVVDQPRP